jgi:hypothetical protein
LVRCTISWLRCQSHAGDRVDPSGDHKGTRRAASGRQHRLTSASSRHRM